MWILVVCPTDYFILRWIKLISKLDKLLAHDEVLVVPDSQELVINNDGFGFLSSRKEWLAGVLRVSEVIKAFLHGQETTLLLVVLRGKYCEVPVLEVPLVWI